uniref:Uncharacterized protein n=1 Tax=Astatotilapia calliptera TaxID=8154 RepID=A0A3P8NQY0_ASTCA
CMPECSGRHTESPQTESTPRQHRWAATWSAAETRQFRRAAEPGEADAESEAGPGEADAEAEAGPGEADAEAEAGPVEAEAEAGPGEAATESDAGPGGAEASGWRQAEPVGAEASANLTRDSARV